MKGGARRPGHETTQGPRTSTMPSSAARSEANRKNAQKSTGPRSQEGRQRASRNAAKHLLRAEELAFDDADAALLRETLTYWMESYQPETPAEVEFINIAATSSVQIRRSRRFYQAETAENRRNAATRHDQQAEDAVAQLRKSLKDEPEDTVRLLGRSAAGCRWLIGRWERLEKKLGLEGAAGWRWADCDEATRLLGFCPDSEAPEADDVRGLFEAVYPGQAGYRKVAAKTKGGATIDIRDILLSPTWGQPHPDVADPAVAAEREEGLKGLGALIA
jgi:hypothetical protein